MQIEKCFAMAAALLPLCGCFDVRPMLDAAYTIEVKASDELFDSLEDGVTHGVMLTIERQSTPPSTPNIGPVLALCVNEDGRHYQRGTLAYSSGRDNIPNVELVERFEWQALSAEEDAEQATGLAKAVTPSCTSSSAYATVLKMPRVDCASEDALTDGASFSELGDIIGRSAHTNFQPSCGVGQTAALNDSVSGSHFVVSFEEGLLDID